MFQMAGWFVRGTLMADVNKSFKVARMPMAICARGNIFFPFAPLHEEFAGRQSLQARKWGDLPVAYWPYQERNHAGLVSLMPLHRTLHLDTIAIVGCHKIRIDQQEDKPGSVQVIINFRAPMHLRIGIDNAFKPLTVDVGA